MPNIGRIAFIFLLGCASLAAQPDAGVKEAALRDGFRKAAEAGDSRAMVDLGKAYLLPKDPARDPAEAMRWFRKAVDLGDAGGMAQAGRLYQYGWGVPKDDNAAKGLRTAAINAPRKNSPRCRERSGDTMSRMRP
jgi:TPR repeat protein